MLYLEAYMRLTLFILLSFNLLFSCGEQQVETRGVNRDPVLNPKKQETNPNLNIRPKPDKEEKPEGSGKVSTSFSIGDESSVDKKNSQYLLSIKVAKDFMKAQDIEEETFYKTGSVIMRNETGNDLKKLVYFSSSESFPSLGINHFIWICPDHPKYSSFGSSFTKLLYFLKDKGFKIPSFISNFECTWKHRSKSGFQSDSTAQTQAKELHSFLSHTRAAQAVFSFKRFIDALPKILDGAGSQRSQFESKIKGVQNSSAGYFPLIDYVNFKGEGVFSLSNTSSYGLFQVLQEMKSSGDPLSEFADSAIRTLKNRRSATDWNKFGVGWSNRLNRYKTLSVYY